VVGRLPWSALAAWGAVIGWLAGSVLRIRRAHVEAAMRTAGIDGPRRAARAMYTALGRSACEFLWIAARRGSLAGVARIDDASRALLARARAGGRGVVLAASHTGNWDLAACAVAAEVPLLVVTKRLSARSLDAFWQGSRAALGVALCEAAGALRRGRAHLARGGAVAMMIDQVPLAESHAEDVPFLGRPALVDRAPAALAAASGAPLVVTAARRDEGGRHVLSVLRVIEPPPRAGPSWVASATREATLALDAFVREHPSQWLWLHRRWRGAASRGGGRVLSRPVDERPVDDRR